MKKNLLINKENYCKNKIKENNKKISENHKTNISIENTKTENQTNKKSEYNHTKLMNSTKNNETLSEGIGKIINNPRQPLPFPLTNKIEFLQKKVQKKMKKMKKMEKKKKMK